MERTVRSQADGNVKAYYDAENVKVNLIFAKPGGLLCLTAWNELVDDENKKLDTLISRFDQRLRPQSYELMGSHNLFSSWNKFLLKSVSS